MNVADELALERWQATDDGLAEMAIHSLHCVLSDLEKMTESRRGTKILREGVESLMEANSRLIKVVGGLI